MENRVTQQTKFAVFVDALTQLCKVHGVTLSTSGYDGLQVWDAGAMGEPIHCAGIEDRTHASAPTTKAQREALEQAKASAANAWFSPRAAAIYGTSWWEMTDGREVELTANEDEEAYRWPDKVFVGRVTRWLRAGRKP